MKNSINRTNVVKKPINSFDACEDLFILVVHCHIIVAAMKRLGMESLDAIPNAPYIPKDEEIWMLSAKERQTILDKITEDVFDSYFDISYNSRKATSSGSDMVQSYAQQILSLGSFYMELKDAVKEGDGLRTLRCYRYLLPMFKNSGRKNYAIETLNFLLQHDYTLSERQASELIWSRFINTHGLRGRIISK